MTKNKVFIYKNPYRRDTLMTMAKTKQGAKYEFKKLAKQVDIKFVREYEMGNLRKDAVVL